MKIDRVTYQKIFPTGMMYLNHKIGTEIQLDDGDDPERAFVIAKEFVEKMNLESNPGMAVAMEYMKVFQDNGSPLPVSQVNKSNDSLIDNIQSCKEFTELETYKLMVKGNPGLQQIYDKKLLELTN